MPSAGPVNKLVMESVDTQQHSTELLDNLQIRTFDAFLLTKAARNMRRDH